MTHEANISDKMDEEEWRLCCEEYAKEASNDGEGKDSEGQEEEKDPPQA